MTNDRNAQLQRDFEAAQALYRAGRVDDAAAILRKMNHPKADAALRKIGRPNRRGARIRIAVGVTILLVALVVGLIVNSVLQANALTTQLETACVNFLRGSDARLNAQGVQTAPMSETAMTGSCAQWINDVMAADQGGARSCADRPVDLGIGLDRSEQITMCVMLIATPVPPTFTPEPPPRPGETDPLVAACRVASPATTALCTEWAQRAIEQETGAVRMCIALYAGLHGDLVNCVSDFVGRPPVPE